MRVTEPNPPTSLQDAFNRIWTHFVTEGNPRSIGSYISRYGDTVPEGCVYGGTGCVVGIFLPLEIAEKYEGRSAPNLWDAECVSEYLGNTVTREEWSRLQGAHDKADNDADFHKRLRAFASNHNLTIPEQTK